MFKALIGAAVVVLLAVLSKTRNYYIAGLVPLFPTFALIAHYIVGKGRSLDDLKTTIVFGMWSIIPSSISPRSTCWSSASAWRPRWPRRRWPGWWRQACWWASGYACTPETASAASELDDAGLPMGLQVRHYRRQQRLLEGLLEAMGETGDQLQLRATDMRRHARRASPAAADRRCHGSPGSAPADGSAAAPAGFGEDRQQLPLHAFRVERAVVGTCGLQQKLLAIIAHFRAAQRRQQVGLLLDRLLAAGRLAPRQQRSSDSLGAGRPSAPELVITRVRLSRRCGAMSAMCWAIIPPMLAPSTWAWGYPARRADAGHRRPCR